MLGPTSRINISTVFLSEVVSSMTGSRTEILLNDLVLSKSLSLADM